jgi:putative membrane protein
MPSDHEQTYGRSTSWQPGRARLKVFPLLVSWFATGVALMVASWALPGVDIVTFWGALVVAVIVAALNAVIPPVLAAIRLPLTLVLGFLLVLIADALILQLAAEFRATDGLITVDNFGWALLAAFIVAAVSVVLAVLLGSDDTDRQAPGHHRQHRHPRDHLPRDRRAGKARAAARDARRQCPEHGALGA